MFSVFKINNKTKIAVFIILFQMDKTKDLN
jgi:hypothetical protein